MRILVVEDERRMADLLRQGLLEDGHAVTVARGWAARVWRLPRPAALTC